MLALGGGETSTWLAAARTLAQGEGVGVDAPCLAFVVVGDWSLLRRAGERAQATGRGDRRAAEFL